MALSPISSLRRFREEVTPSPVRGKKLKTEPPSSPPSSNLSQTQEKTNTAVSSLLPSTPPPPLARTLASPPSFTTPERREGFKTQENIPNSRSSVVAPSTPPSEPAAPLASAVPLLSLPPPASVRAGAPVNISSLIDSAGFTAHTPLLKKAPPPPTPVKPILRRRERAPVEATIGEKINESKRLQRRGESFRLEVLGQGAYKIAYTLAEGQPVFKEGLSNKEIVIKTYSSSRIQQDQNLLREYTLLQMHQLNTLKRDIKIADLLNDPTEDGFFVCKRITPSEDNLEQLVQSLRDVTSLETLPPKLKNLLDQLTKFFTKGVKFQMPIDLSRIDNVILSQNGELVLIDLFESREGYCDKIAKRIIDAALKRDTSLELGTAHRLLPSRGEEGDVEDGEPYTQLKRGLSCFSAGNPLIRSYLLREISSIANQVKVAKQEREKLLASAEYHQARIATLTKFISENASFERAYAIFTS